VASSDASVPPPLGELEAEVMEQVWRQQEATVRSVLEALNATSDRARAYTTVMTVMSNLERKAMLSRRRDGKTDFYTPTVPRGDYVEVRARIEAGALVGRFGESALMAFAREIEQIDPERREHLRRLARDE
jgi:predicted transcriptional regulator